MSTTIRRGSVLGVGFASLVAVACASTSAGGSDGPSATAKTASVTLSAATFERHRQAVLPRIIRVGQRVLVRVADPYGRPIALPSRVISRGGWSPPTCAPERCYAFVARRPGAAEIYAVSPSGCGLLRTQPHACILGNTASQGFNVEPTRCSAGEVRIVTNTPPVESGSLRLTSFSSAGSGQHLTAFRLGYFTDSDHDPNGNPLLYGARIDGGESFQRSFAAATIQGTPTSGYTVIGWNFYCDPGRYVVNVTITKSPGAIYHPGESVKARLIATVTRRLQQ